MYHLKKAPYMFNELGPSFYFNLKEYSACTLLSRKSIDIRRDSLWIQISHDYR